LASHFLSLGHDSDEYDDSDCVIADDGRSDFLITIELLLSLISLLYPKERGGNMCVGRCHPSWLDTMHDDCILKVLKAPELWE
jgi:hypothetical protein